jgi:hypothetical protein
MPEPPAPPAPEPVAPAPVPPAPEPVAPAAPAPPPAPFDVPAAANGSAKNMADDRPEIFVGVAFAGGFLAAQILKRIGRR